MVLHRLIQRHRHIIRTNVSVGSVLIDITAAQHTLPIVQEAILTSLIQDPVVAHVLDLVHGHGRAHGRVPVHDLFHLVFADLFVPLGHTVVDHGQDPQDRDLGQETFGLRGETKDGAMVW